MYFYIFYVDVFSSILTSNYVHRTIFYFYSSEQARTKCLVPPKYQSMFNLKGVATNEIFFYIKWRVVKRWVCFMFFFILYSRNQMLKIIQRFTKNGTNDDCRNLEVRCRRISCVERLKWPVTTKQSIDRVELKMRLLFVTCNIISYQIQLDYRLIRP